MGLSQAQLAKRLGITKSLLSLIENGKRQPTEVQITALAEALQIPTDILLVDTGRLPVDVREAFQADAADAVAAIRQHIEAQVLEYPDLPRKPPVSTATPLPEPTQLPPGRIDVHKTSTSYRAHSYHTKVPPEAIQPFVRAFTRPGETLYDPFCGSGMTGVAALIEGRNALLSDLSPAAVHIARNYTTYCDPQAFATDLEAVEKAMEPTIAWLYQPLGTDHIVEYTTWSDVYRCAACRSPIVYWDVIRRAGWVAPKRLECPKCGARARKSDLEWIGEQPVQTHTSSGSNRIDSHQPTREERALITEAGNAPIPYWIPTVAFGCEREMWRAAHRAMNISEVSGFFTRRNLHALAALRHAIVGASEGRVREALMFAFTATLNRASRRYQWNAKRPTNVMTGTLYISSLRYEWNVWSLFRRKAADVLRYYHRFPRTTASVEVFQRSATDLDCIPDRSIDMVFMDPPFGSNIFYADSSLLWEAWLGELTDQTAEIVVNKHRVSAKGGKRLEEYGELMRQSFAHMARVLKPSGRAVLAFSNSDDAVWETIQKCLGESGFETSSVHLLNKGQPSIKGVKGVSGRENVTTLDLILCLESRRSGVQLSASFLPPPNFIDRVVRDVLSDPTAAAGRRTDEVYSAVIQAVIESKYSVAGITMPVIAARCLALGAMKRGGRWTLSHSNSHSLADFVSGYLTSRDSLPERDNTPPVQKPLERVRVAGGRNSTFYLAHSYHTKLPPEAIQPFIEHYTKPDDVVLDPFCGSGMTGVAAALAGRRAILNDLSPAAIHLAWNHTRPCDPQALAAGFARIEARLSKQFESLYQTTHSDGRPALIHWTLWSTRHRCTNCSHEFRLWDVMDRKSGRLGKTIACPHCKNDLHRSQLEKLGSVPAWIAYETQDGRRLEKEADQHDIERALSLQNCKIWQSSDSSVFQIEFRAANM
jgi:DNA modification methylase/transcriptional regulator with XRE-family HTH domain/DNA-directed RNA polymerase subunit RPC12/RpoP